MYAAAVIILAVLYGVYTYNSLVKLKETVKSAWSDIEVQLKKRFNLIPALVKTVNNYTKYESETLKEITRLRNAFEKGNEEEKIKISQKLTDELNTLLALAESYPLLKADTLFSKLQNELSLTENDIEKARRYYNASVKEYNSKTASFPDMIIAKYFGFKPYPYFKTDNKVYKPPKVG
ncbi:LemA family protein [Nautilia sp.]